MLQIVRVLYIFLNYLLVHVLANVSYIMHPNPVSLLDFKQKASSVALLNCESDDGLYAFVASTYHGQITDHGVHIVDLHNYYIPQIVSVAPSQYAQGCKVSNNILFIADQKQGLVIYNVSDKQNPKLISVTAYTQNSFKPSYQYVLLSSDQKYIFCLSYGFVLTYDITDLANPQILPFPLDFTLAPNSYTLRFDPTMRFIAIANHISGVTILDISNINQQYIRCIQNPSFVTWDVAFTPDKKAFYALDAYFGLFYADPSILYDDSQKGKVSLSFTLVIPVTDSLVMTMEISQDGSLLFIGHRSTGIKIYQLNSQNYKQLIFIQNLQASYMVLCMNLSKNQNQYIYVTNGIQLIIFKLVQPNTNQDFPNLFNTFQSSLTFVSPDQNQLSIQCTQKEVMVTATSVGIFIFDITDPFYPNLYENYIKQSQTKGTISLITTTFDFNTLLIANQQGGLVTFDISNRSNPQYKNQYQLIQNKQSYTEYTSVRISKDGTKVVVGNSFYGVLIYMFDNPQDLSSLVLTNGYANQYACGFERCDFTSDATKFVCACREIGTIFFQLLQPGIDPIAKYAFNEIAVEQAIISQNDKLLYLANGFQGIFIIDITNFFEPKKLSQLVLQGWVQWVTPIFNEKYLMVSQVEKGQLSLVNIEDPANPYEQQRIEFLGESSTASCLSPSNPTNLYFLGNTGLRYVPIQPSITMHTQFQVQQLDNNGNLLYYQTLEQGAQLLVGQNIRIIYTQLYNEQKIQVNNAFYYRQFGRQALPPWITFLPSQSQIIMVVDKLGTLNDFSTEKNGENILILQVQVQLQSQKLINNSLKIDQTLASRLLILLEQNGFVDVNGYITEKFDPQVPFDLNFYDGVNYTPTTHSSVYQQIQQQLKKILAFSKVEYPIRFFIVSSLKFNYSQKLRQQNASDSGSVISTPSQQVSILMQITSNGKFVKKIFEGVLASFSDDLTSVKITGQTSFVNAIMNNSIQIANQTQDLSQVAITFLISDSNNYDQTIKISLKEADFIQIHQPVQLNANKTLQGQLEKYYSNGQLPIVDRFQFSFDLETFIQPDGLPITYSAYILNGDNPPQQILTGSWIDFNNLSLGFSGIRTASYFWTTTTVRVIADDGYSKAHCDFNMTFNQIPFFYAFQLIVSVVGPIVGIISIWKYRSEIHLFVSERKHMYQNEIAVTGELFKKQIILYGKVQSDALTLWKMLRKQDKSLNQSLKDEYKLNQTIDVYNLVSKLEKVYHENTKKFPYLDPREFDFHDSRLVRSVKRLAYQVVLDNDQTTLEVFEKLKKFSTKNFGYQDWYKKYLVIYPIMEIKGEKVIHRVIEQQDKVNDQLESRSQLFNENLINNQLKIKDCNVETLKKIDLDLQNDENKQNMISANIQSQIYSGENTKRLSQRGNSENDLCQKLDTVKTQGKEQIYINLNPFPEIFINQQIINQTLLDIRCQLQYDFNLLAEIIALEASGALTGNPSSFNPSYGESIHTIPQELDTLQAFCKNKEDGCGQKILKFLNMQYSPVGFVKNNPLPKWLNFQIIDGIINIWGIPQPSDEPEILIRIINDLGLAIYSFHIFIQDKEGNDMRNKQILRKFTIQNKPNQNKQTGITKMHSSVNIMSQQFGTPQIKNTMSANNESPQAKIVSQQLIGTKSQFANEQTKLTGQNSLPNFQEFQLCQLQKIDEERPSVLQQFHSNIDATKFVKQNSNLESNLPQKQMELKEKITEINSSVIIEIDSNFKEFNEVDNDNQNKDIRKSSYKFKPQ
ncbi:transmembrane protein, putative (macronuclear) [Tetrahymena thermophila SB210]|uniref:Transmembrane protein, putative n=1 Tax=Tetrahymena thermophila (strain SB210) TaxID=312017 RepID=I7M796_TETTS|nr:transmembrane protein, putative [Tetrahymena thermophila SB210]EAR90814.2 transmembrane protein, putative [Tetrahymena thermophila SB210]|eukprot:XP_001011059.2 transmembrane protein, putative [Tetrahymena thermophila SB210]